MQIQPRQQNYSPSILNKLPLQRKHSHFCPSRALGFESAFPNLAYSGHPFISEMTSIQPNSNSDSPRNPNQTQGRNKAGWADNARCKQLLNKDINHALCHYSPP